MPPSHDLDLLIQSQIPLIVIESHEELRVLDLLKRLAVRTNRPLFHWTVTQGLQRLDIDLPAQAHNREPEDVLRHIKSAAQDAVYVLADFHPFLKHPVNVRLLKDIALHHAQMASTIILLSHRLELPGELRRYSASFQLALPSEQELEDSVRAIAQEWTAGHPGKRVKTDRQTLDALLQNLRGLTSKDAKRLIRNAIYDDGAITNSDLPRVMRAKYELLNTDGVLAYEYDTARFADVAGLQRLKDWLTHRQATFKGELQINGLAQPKGVLLMGVQGCGKSLAAKAVAGMWHVPLLRLDFGALYNKYHGESERNLREALRTAEVMAPCVLWMDEIEKGVAGGHDDTGVSRRILATLLTWMAEKQAAVFVVATANDIDSLPPELVRKGRFDEIFFIDLPARDTRAEILRIHLDKRELAQQDFDIEALADASAGFSGSELEQAVVAALYTAHAQQTAMRTEHLLHEVEQTRPLSQVMAERVAALRAWANDRTVPAD